MGLDRSQVMIPMMIQVMIPMMITPVKMNCRWIQILSTCLPKEAEKTRGQGDATATATYAEAYNRDPEFYDFTRSLRAYRNTFRDEGDILLIDPDSDYFKYLNKSDPK